MGGAFQEPLAVSLQDASAPSCQSKQAPLQLVCMQVVTAWVGASGEPYCVRHWLMLWVPLTPPGQMQLCTLVYADIQVSSGRQLVPC